MNSGHLQKRNYGRPARGWRFGARVDWRPVRRASFFLLACWLLSNAAPNALSQNEEAVEYPLKLAFLYNFTKFIQWPADSYHDSGAPLTICIVGQDPFSPDVEEKLRARTVEGHPLEIRTLKPTDTLTACHIAFVPVREKDQSAKIVRGLQGSSTLTVGETEGFAVMGGIINLTVEENKLHFEVNLPAAERARLKISSTLLSLAKIIKE